MSQNGQSHRAAKCSSCPAAVIWAETEKGKRIPIDPKPVVNGNIYLVHRGSKRPPLAVHAKFHRPDGQTVPRYRSHFASCPNAHRHRRKSPAAPKDKPQQKEPQKQENQPQCSGQGNLPV